jgi:putative ABC transport system permease protein
MMSPRWKKLLRDLQAAQGRMLMMVLAMSVSIFGVGTMLTAYTVASREMVYNYLDTNPAHAFIELDRVDDALVEVVRQEPNIADAEAASWINARVEIAPHEWMPLLLFVVDDFSDMRLSTFRPEQGEWPPAEQSILVEREVVSLINVNIGDTLTVQTPNGSKQAIQISGIVHDPSLAPAWQEQTVYGYISASTLTYLGESADLQILKIQVTAEPASMPLIEATVSDLAAQLEAQGYTVGEIRIPPPYKHPHQGQMNAVMMILLSFSIMALILSAILTATMIGGLLAQQIRQIGIMKAIGARSSQITGMYLALVAALGTVAFVIGAPLGIIAGRGFATVVAQLLNLTIYNDAVPVWVYLILLLMAVLTPLLVAQYPIRRTSGITVREIINDYGISRESFGSRKLDTWLGSLGGLDKTLLMALRNTFRRRGRLLLTLSLLAAAGGMFMTGINVKTAWETYLANAAADRHYDLEIRFNAPEEQERISAIISGISGVEMVESWNLTAAAVYRSGGLDIVRTYPDGGHGSFTLRSTLPETPLIGKPMLSGHWLQTGDDNAVVLNQSAAAFFPKVQIGDEISLLLDGQEAKFRLVGIIRQVLNPATAYVLPATFADTTGQAPETTNAVRVVMQAHDEASITAVLREIEMAFALENISIKQAISEALLDDAVTGHVYIFIVALLFISAVMGVVGTLGLMSSMGTSVIERTREFGIMRAIGAESRVILRNIISEGIFIGLLSCLIAIPLSIPLSLGLGAYLGTLAFRSPLPFILAPMGLSLWLIVLVIGSIAASAYPAQQASRLTIRETLAYL